jgi:NitT/TauT family transport system ATP-binding protein
MTPATKSLKVQVIDLQVSLEVQSERLEVLRNISMTIDPGQIVSILGPSGSGKSTLLHTLCDLIQPLSGKVLLNDLSPTQARKQHWIGLVPQRPTLFPHRSVLGNLHFPLNITGMEPTIPLNAILELVQLSDFRDAYPAELSGGMRQRAALARALVIQPKLLLMDEPFSSLDQLLREELQKEFLQIQRRMKQTVIFVTHNVEEAVFMADKIVIFTPLPGQVKGVVNLPEHTIPDKAWRVHPDYFRSIKSVRKWLET